jgi:hypothetical protein
MPTLLAPQGSVDGPETARAGSTERLITTASARSMDQIDASDGEGARQAARRRAGVERSSTGKVMSAYEYRDHSETEV